MNNRRTVLVEEKEIDEETTLKITPVTKPIKKEEPKELKAFNNLPQGKKTGTHKNRVHLRMYDNQWENVEKIAKSLNWDIADMQFFHAFFEMFEDKETYKELIKIMKPKMRKKLSAKEITELNRKKLKLERLRKQQLKVLDLEKKLER